MYPDKKYEYVLKIDIDLRLDKWHWFEDYIRTVRAILKEFGYPVVKVRFEESSSKRGFHFWFTIQSSRKISDAYLNRLQFFCYDDRTRVVINRIRIRKGVKVWNKLFSKVVWKKELEDPCKSCRLMRYVREAVKQLDKTEEK